MKNSHFPRLNTGSGPIIRRAVLLAAVLLAGRPALGGLNAVNTLTNGPGMSTALNWSLNSAPTSISNAGSFTDAVLGSATNALTTSSTHLYAESWNVTNGGSYSIGAVANNVAPNLYLGGSAIVQNGTNFETDGVFTNSVSGGACDLIYLANNSALVINPTNAGTGNTNLTILMRQGGNFNVAAGSALTVNAGITQFHTGTGVTNTGGGTVTLNGTNGYTGPTVVSAGTFVLNGTLTGSSITVSNGVFDEGVTGTIAGAASTLTVGAGTASLMGTNTYGGVTKLFDTLQVYGPAALPGSTVLTSGPSDANNSTLNLAAAGTGYAVGQLSLGGIMNFTGPGSGAATLTISGGGALTGTTEKKITVGTNTTVLLNGTEFDLIGSAGVNNRELQLTVNGALTVNAVLDDNASGGSTGNVGYVYKQGSGVLTLNAANIYGGPTTNAEGTTLVNGSVNGAGVTVTGGTLGGTGVILSPTAVNAGGTLAPGNGAIATFTVSNSLTLAGNVLIKVNKAVSPSNDMVNVSGALAYGGTLTVTNSGGTALALGDQFAIFPAGGTGSLTVAGSPGAGLAWSFSAATGVLSVTTASAPVMTLTPAGGSLGISWTQAGYKLQSETNAINVGLTTNSASWFDYPGGGTSPVSITPNPAAAAVFFRLAPQ